MPSVGMRRTRVCVDGVRVLRSGRRLWPESGDGKFRRANDGDEWLHTMLKSSTTASTTNKNHHNNSNSSVKCKVNGWTHVSKLKKEAPAVDAEVPKKVFKRVVNRVKAENLKNDTVNKMFGLVYTRKRKRVDKQENQERKMFGIQFSRKQLRRRQGGNGSLVNYELAPLAVFIEGSCSSGLVSFLNLVFGYIRRASLRFSELAAFLSTEPVSSAFGSDGIRFLQDTTANRIGICKFFGARSTVPLFSLDFSAIPLCFMYMHLNLLVRFKCLSFVPVNTSLDEDSCDEESEDDPSCGPMKADTVEETGKSDNSRNKVVLHPSVRASKLAGRNSHYRNGLNSRGIQKRRSSLRRRTARNLSLVGIHKANGSLVSDLVSSRKNGIPFSSVVSKNKLRCSVQSSPAAKPSVASPAVVEVTRDMDSSSCYANILVIESDRCYRIEGVTITLEISDSKEWVLVMKKDGLARYTHLAQKSMRPCSSNRVTHDIIWTGDESWKLEFPNRPDWVLFKELYKECSDRNVLVPISKAIPVPGVYEVLGYEESSSSVPFTRPDVYISINNDEVARALAKKTANYDMDSEDEDWLKKFNNEFSAETENREHFSEDSFELMIDAIEKAFYCSPDDIDENAAVNLCIELGRKEVVQAVYGYWTKKRKQRRSTLLRVFQGHQATKTQLIPKPVLRKRRSFKRQASQFGRGKQPSLLQAMAAEHDALEEQNAMHKLEAAKTSANNSAESAIVKRQRAQMLMENADLALYKAAMALRIAEAVGLAYSTDVLTQFFD